MVKVIGIGDNVVDINLDTQMMAPGGQALNVAANAAMLGAQAAYMGSFGNDRAKDCCTGALTDLGVDFSHCRYYPVPNFPSYYKTIDNDRVFVDPPIRIHPMTPGLFEMLGYEGFSEDDYTYIHSFDVVHLSNDSRLDNYLPEWNRRKIRMSYDFSIFFSKENYLESVCPYVTFAFLSLSHLSEAEREETLRIVNSLGAKYAIGTMGENGAMLFDGLDFYCEPAIYLENVVDTMGAGDAFTAGFLVEFCHSEQKSIKHQDVIKNALRAGVEYASKVCLKKGALGYGIILEKNDPLLQDAL